MKIEKIEWCCLQKGGIRLIEPNKEIGQKYLEEADRDFAEMKHALTLKWKDIMAYYSCYNSIYAIMQKIGIKCEIHECTLEIIDLISEIINFEFSISQKSLIRMLKGKRIGVQYYLEKPEEINEKNIADFILTCKEIFNAVSFDDLEKIRKQISKIIGNLSNKNGIRKN